MMMMMMNLNLFSVVFRNRTGADRMHCYRRHIFYVKILRCRSGTVQGHRGLKVTVIIERPWEVFYPRWIKTLCLSVFDIHRVSKKLCQLIFYSMLVKYEPILIKIGMHVLEETTNRTVQTVLTSPIMCASTTLGNLKWQIELSTQYLHVHFNESLNSYKTTGSYCLGNRRTCSKSHYLYIMCSKCLSPARTQARRCWRHDANRTFNELFTRFWCVFTISRHLRRTLPACNVKMM